MFLQHFITSNFDDLQSFAPSSKTDEAVEITEIVPMKVLFRDEKYVAEIVGILGDLVRDAHLSGTQGYNRTVFTCTQLHTCIHRLW